MKKLTIFGTIEFGRSKFTNGKLSPVYIGGNGILSSLAASRHVDVDLIGVVGSDLDKKVLQQKLGKKINVDNITQLEGETFKWTAIYDPKSSELVDQEIEFGVYAKYDPQVIKASTKKSEHILFSGSKPQLGLKVLSQFANPEFIAVDVLLYHLENNFDASVELIKKADILFVNSKEFKFLKKRLGNNLFKTFNNLQYIFQKKGKKGVAVIQNSLTIHFPSPKKVSPQNPTGAGDAFSGNIVGAYLTSPNFKTDLPKIIKMAQTESIKTITNHAFYRLLAV